MVENDDLGPGGRPAERKGPVQAHRDEEQGQVEQGVAVHAPGDRRHRPLPKDPDAVPQEPGAEQRGGDAVDRPQRPEERRQDRERQQDQGVDQHLVLGPRLAPDDRHHGDARAGIVGLLDQRERPEVGWGPVEDDGEEIDRGEVQAARHRRPPDQRGKRARGAADHDVLRARPLEPDGVDEDVEEQPAEREPGAQRIHLDTRRRQRRRSRARCRTPARTRA